MQAIRNVLHGGGSGAAPQHGDKFNFEVASLQMSPGVPVALNDKRFNPYLSIWRVGDKVALAKTRSIKENVLGLGVINFSETHDFWCNPTDSLVMRLYDDNFIKDTIIAEAPINLQSLMAGVSQPIQLFPVADRFRPTTGAAGGPGVAGGGLGGSSGLGMGGGLGGPGVASGGLGAIPLCTVMCKARLLQAGGGGQTGIPGVGKQAVGGTGTGVGGPSLAAGGVGAGGLGAGGLGAGGVGASGLGGGGLAGTQQSGFGSGYGTTQQAGYAGGLGSAPATGSAYGSGVTSSSVAPMSGGGLAAGGLGAGGLGSGIGSTGGVAPAGSSYDSSYSRTSTSQSYGSTGVLPQSGAVSSSGLMGSGLPQQQQGVGGISTTGVSQSASDIGGLSKPTTFTTGASTSGIGQQQGLQPGRGY